MSGGNKCLLIHIAAASCCAPGDTHEVLGGKSSRILQLARDYRVLQYKQAIECQRELGEPTSNDPLVVAELRSHVHRIPPPNHDRDHKSLLCFPLPAMNDINLRLMRVSPSCLYSIHVTNSVTPSNKWSYLVSYQGHMRIIFPPSFLIGASIRSAPKTVSQPVGWSDLLKYNSHTNVGIDVKALTKCPTCQAPSIRLPLGVDGALVGRCVIMSDSELRSFAIAKPWAKAAAEECGPDALEAWEGENASPPLDQPPLLTTEAQRALKLVFGTIPPIGTEFNMKVWGAISSRVDEFADLVGNVFTAAHAFTALWRKNS